MDTIGHQVSAKKIQWFFFSSGKANSSEKIGQTMHLTALHKSTSGFSSALESHPQSLSGSWPIMILHGMPTTSDHHTSRLLTKNQDNTLCSGPTSEFLAGLCSLPGVFFPQILVWLVPSLYQTFTPRRPSPHQKQFLWGTLTLLYWPTEHVSHLSIITYGPLGYLLPPECSYGT